jgi:hypothetical protein
MPAIAPAADMAFPYKPSICVELAEFSEVSFLNIMCTLSGTNGILVFEISLGLGLADGWISF